MIRNIFKSFLRKESSSPRASMQDGGILISNSQDLENYLRGLGAETQSGAVVTPQSALQRAVVHRCVSIIAGSVANMPLQLKRRVDDRTREDASDHSLSRILTRKPNRWMTPSAFRRLLTLHVLLRGNGYALIVRSMGKIIELIPLHPDRVSIKQIDDFSIKYTYTRKDGRQVEFPQSEIFHLMGMSLDGVRGVSVLECARESIGLSAQAQNHSAAIFKNGATMGAVLKHPKMLSNEARDALRSSMDNFRGAENAYKTLVLEEGLDIEKLTMTAEDMAFIDTAKMTRADIGMFFGVPPHLYGDTEKTTSFGSGIEHQSLGFVAYTMEDWLTAWEQTIDRDLIGDADPQLFSRFNRAALVRGDIKTRWAAHKDALQWGVCSPNEIREIEDLNPREGGDIYYDPPNTAGTPQGERSDELEKTA